MSHECRWEEAVNIFLPREAKIVKTAQPTELEKHFTLEMVDGEPMEYQPGQIVEPASSATARSRSGSPARRPRRKASTSSSARSAACRRPSTARRSATRCRSAARSATASTSTSCAAQDVLIVAGGIGLCPTRSMIQYILDNRDEFGSSRSSSARASLACSCSTTTSPAGAGWRNRVLRDRRPGRSRAGPATSASSRRCSPRPSSAPRPAPSSAARRSCTSSWSRELDEHRRPPRQHLRRPRASHEVRRRQVRPLPDQRQVRLCRRPGVPHSPRSKTSRRQSRWVKPRVAWFDFACCEGCQIEMTNFGRSRSSSSSSTSRPWSSARR